MLATLRLFGPGYTWVVAGYPPFLRTLLDTAAAEGLDLSAYRLHGFVGGEGMSEALRDRLERTLQAVYSAYGASDLDIGVAAELPLSVWLRQQAARRPELAQALFGTRTRLPMLFQYDPTDYHVETVGGELVVTVCRPTVLSPRIRYNIHDAGGSLSYRHALDVCRDFGLDPERDSRTRSTLPPLRLPFLYVHGRSDSTISIHGANIYPEDVEWGLGEAADADLVLGYALDVDEDALGATRPLIHVETSAPGTPGLAARLADAVRLRLLANSADVRAAAMEDPHVTEIEVRLHPPGTGPFHDDGSRIKRRYVLAASAR
jgi:phenylacetate-CoA ligase